jgi:hypothetical protein
MGFAPVEQEAVCAAITNQAARTRAIDAADTIQ